LVVSLKKCVLFYLTRTNVVAGDNELRRIKENGIVETKAAKNIKVAGALVGDIVGAALAAPCLLLYPGYCWQYPISANYEGRSDKLSGSNWANLMITSVAFVAVGSFTGYKIGSAIAQRWLPNGGKVTAVKYITSSMDETV
jgi:hypothetical protein